MDNFLYSTAQIRAIEQAAFAGVIASDALMQEAGTAAFAVLRESWPEARRLLILCGTGNNGGDGYVIARLAKEAGLDVTLIALDAPKTADALAMASAARQAGVTPQPWSGVLPDTDVIVDALLGIGLNSPLRGPVAEMVAAVNRSGLPVLAVDLPTGIDADTGAVWGDAISANITVTFLGDKPGLLTGEGASHAGRRIVKSLRLPASCYPEQPLGRCLSDADLRFPARTRNSHKGDFGHVLVIGGDQGMGGAGIMAAEAALRAGAGRVTLATHPDHVAAMLARCPAVMVRGIHHPAELEPLLVQASVIIVGPGLGRHSWGQRLWQAVQSVPVPQIVDADGLYWLAQSAPSPRADRILTPHPGEAATLLGEKTADVQRDRIAAIRRLAARFGGIPVLKGAGTLLASGDALALCPFGNPGMATAGMGDVLAGVTGGLVAQFGANFETVSRAVLAHALAGDKAAVEGQRGLMATDLLPWVRECVNHA